jgi:hypothetical protein
MQVFDFVKIKEDLDALADKVAEGHSKEIQLQARRLAEDLETYGKGINPSSITSREIAEQLRDVEYNSHEPEVAAPYLEEALRIFRQHELNSGIRI